MGDPSAPVWRPIDIERDAPGLAEMWNASDDQWPGSATGGVAMTADTVRRRHEMDVAIETLVCDAGDAIAGYCLVQRDPEEPHVAWISLLNVAPAYQGRGLAREVLVHWAARAAELGYSRLDLGTWGGNRKAVPLYKKCGFFWMPGPWPHMFNFIPAILRFPLARGFFARHDWYTSLQRELSQGEDDERAEGMKVFTYRFESDGEALTVWVDREARAICGIDTGELYLAALASDLEPPRGLPAGVAWRLRNTGDVPVRVAVVASGTEHLAIDHRETVDLPPGADLTLRGEVRVASRVPDALVHPNRPAPSFASAFLVGSEVADLRTGLRPRLAVEVSTHPRYVTTSPGVTIPVTLRLRNRLTTPVTATVTLLEPAGVACAWSERTVEIEADGFAGLPLEVRADREGAFELPVRVAFDHDGARVETEPQPQWVFSVADGVVAARMPERVRVETAQMRAIVEEMGAELEVTGGSGLDAWMWEAAVPAPPVRNNEFSEGVFDLAVEREGGRVTVVARRASREHPGLSFVKRVEVATQDLRISYRLENAGAHERALRLAQWITAGESLPTLVVPFAAGPVAGPAREFPGPSDETSRDPGRYAEAWWARTSPRAAIGVVWPREETAEIAWEQGFERRTALLTLPARTSVETAPVVLTAGDGGWRGVRARWRRLAGAPLEVDEREDDPRPYVSAYAARPIVCAGDESSCEIVVEHHSTRTIDGELTIAPPDGWEADRTAVPLERVRWDAPARLTIGLKTSAEPGAATGRLEIRSPEIDIRQDVTFTRLGDGGPVRVTEIERAGQRLLAVDNGRLAFEVAPGFAGTITSLRDRDRELLRSAFPQRGTFSFFNDWHGGIAPALSVGRSDKLWKEATTADEVVRTEDGIAWSGVRERFELREGEDWRGLALEAEILTVGGSPFVRLVERVTNTTSSVRRVRLGWDLYPGGDATIAAPDRTLKLTGRLHVTASGRWAAAVTADRAVGIVCGSPRAYGIVFARDGFGLGVSAPATIEAGETLERVAYVVVAPDAAGVERAVALTDAPPRAEAR